MIQRMEKVDFFRLSMSTLKTGKCVRNPPARKFDCYVVNGQNAYQRGTLGESLVSDEP